MRRQPGAVIGGLGLVLTGGWLIATGLGAPLIGFDRLWPALLVILGLALLVQQGARGYRGNGLVLIGVAALLTGAFLCVFTLQVGGLDWPDMAGYWPIFFVIAGTAFTLAYVAGGMREQPLLVPIYALGGFGLLALPITLGIIRGAVFNQALRLSPLLLFLIGLGIFLRLRSQRRDTDAGSSE